MTNDVECIRLLLKISNAVLEGSVDEALFFSNQLTDKLYKLSLVEANS